MDSKGKKTGDNCLQCPISGICGGASMPDPEVPESLRWRAILLTLVVPLALLMGGLCGAWILGFPRILSAVIALSLPVLYYLSFYLYTEIIKRNENCPSSN